MVNHYITMLDSSPSAPNRIENPALLTTRWSACGVSPQVFLGDGRRLAHKKLTHIKLEQCGAPQFCVGL
jgi:hypothetical protein